MTLSTKSFPVATMTTTQVSDFLVLELERLQTLSVSLNPACRAYSRKNIVRIEELNQLVDTCPDLDEIADNIWFIVEFGFVNLVRE